MSFGIFLRLQADVVEHILREAPILAETLLDGLIWRSHKTQAAMAPFHQKCVFSIKIVQKFKKPVSEYRDFLQNTHHISSHHARDISLSQDGLRPVIYYLEHLVQDMDESQMLSRALVSFVKFKHPRTIMHPILIFVLDLLWENLVPWSPNHTI